MSRVSNVGLGLALVAASLGTSPAHAQSADPCGGQPNCAATRGFTATITNFRPSTVDVRTKAIAITMRFENRTNQPLILGYINDSGIITDDQGQRYVTNPAGVRGIGVIASQFDPKFVLRPGEASDARFEMVLRMTGANPILGTKYEMDLAVREIVPLAGNQFQLGREHSLHFAALGPSDMADVGSPEPATPAATPAATEPAAAPEPEADPCAGKSRCYGAGPFTAEVTRLTPSQAGRHHVVTLTLRFRNVSPEPLIIAYKSGSNSAVDNYGNRYYYGRAGTVDGSVKGMGMVTSRAANPQFALKPGQSRDATFTLVRFNARAPFGESFAYDVAFEQLEILPSNQIRSVREYAVNFTDVSTSSAGAAVSGAKKLIDAIRKPRS